MSDKLYNLIITRGSGQPERTNNIPLTYAQAQHWMEPLSRAIMNGVDGFGSVHNVHLEEVLPPLLSERVDLAWRRFATASLPAAWALDEWLTERLRVENPEERMLGSIQAARAWQQAERERIGFDGERFIGA